MATLIAPTAADIQYSGEEGNQSVAQGTYTATTTTINDTVYLLKLYAGSKINGVKLINAAMGTSATVDVGFQYVNGESGSALTAFFAAQAVSTAGMAHSAARPVKILYDAYVIITFKGAAQTGLLDVVVEYEFRG